MKKKFLLDTNILMGDPRSLFVFEDNDVYICSTTLEELDNLKERQGETGYEARKAIRAINEIRKNGNVSNGVEINNGGIFKVIPDFNSASIEQVKEKCNFPNYWSFDKADNRIIVTASLLNAILVTNDISMIIKAETIGVKTENYKHEQVSESSMQYTGSIKVYAETSVIDKFYTEGEIDPSELCNEQDIQLYANEFLIIEDYLNKKHTALGRYDGNKIVKLKYDNSRPSDVVPKNAAQRFAIEALMAPASEIPLVILRGPAGTAKSFLSLAVGLEQVMNQHNYKKMLMFRPNVKFDEDIGYLKGDEMDKIKPLLRPCFDNLEVLLSHKDDDPAVVNDKIDELFDRGYLYAEAMAYLRGRSIANTYIICEECQNSSNSQMLGIISRAGIDSKIVIVGDPDQIDTPKLDKRNNGLVYACEKMLDSKLCAQVSFTHDECVRSPLAQEASELLKKK